jgi:anaerobic ribonucleoside-triphosphate reductase activating protein
MLPFEGGSSVNVDDLVNDIVTARDALGIEGITLLGGEPIAHAAGAAELAKRVRQAGLSVMVFSGYTLGELRARPQPEVAQLLAATDILVDGPYRRELPETRRRWIGSANQAVHFLTDGYRADDPRWLLANTLEIRLAGGELTINGFPTRAASDFWRRLPQRAQAE